jgi:hypothetical protein
MGVEDVEIDFTTNLITIATVFNNGNSFFA